MTRLIETLRDIVSSQPQAVRTGFVSHVEVRPDLITLDLVMPLMDGMAGPRSAQGQTPSSPRFQSSWSPIVDHDASGLLSAGAPSLITSADRDRLAAVLNRHDQSLVDEVTFAYNGVQ